VNLASLPKRPNPPPFCQLLRKHLTGATIAGVEQLLGERIVDIVFACVDEVGSTSLKVLSAEIMGRHSNLIFWNKENDQILGASHLVTRDMSRQREILPGLKYVRPPSQDKPNIFKLTRDEFERQSGRLAGMPISGQTVADWLLDTFAGLGRHLAEEIAAAFALAEQSAEAVVPELWGRIETVQRLSEYKPAMRTDLSRFTVLSWYGDMADERAWKTFPSVNDMLEEYFRAQELKERFQQLRDRLSAELHSEHERLEARRAAAAKQLEGASDAGRLKKYGDLILAHLQEIAPGQEELVCQDLYEPCGGPVRIPLNPNLNAAQNAQHYYRQFAKSRTRVAAARAAESEALARLGRIREQVEHVEAARTTDDLEQLRDTILVRRAPVPARPVTHQQPAAGKKKNRMRLLSMTSSDGWTIYVGRNRHENDELITRVAQPQDVWLHVKGQGGAHVLIKVPSARREPPGSTMKEAAQAAARLSKTAAGGKVRVMYTQCRYVRKVPGKPGLVTYENERTIEVDTSGPMPAPLKQLFARGRV
jgi:predicted ribosome quality control (RQC) complex YloA/Tae2 family protein